jgi:hypothetical protein
MAAPTEAQRKYAVGILRQEADDQEKGDYSPELRAGLRAVADSVESGDDRVRCVLAGAILADQARYLNEAVRLARHAQGSDEFAEGTRNMWLKAARSGQGMLETILPVVEACGLKRERDVLSWARRAVDDAREIGPGFSERAFDDVLISTSNLLHSLESQADEERIVDFPGTFPHLKRGWDQEKATR